MNISDNSALLVKILDILSSKFNIDIDPEEVNKAANQGGAYKPVETNNAKLELILNKLTYATNELTDVINQGINVSGEFKQRGTDLYATVEKVRTLKGSATILNNPAFAR